MLETDNLTYSYRSRPAALLKAKPAERMLLTLERSQKLDLLIHLLANLHKSLILTGPRGIGKTTLLNALKDSHQSIWPICILQGSASLSFEAVINQLSRFLELTGARSGFDLSLLRNYCEKQKVVLVIDDADLLLPGLINELMDFADSLRNLRLVCAMNYDEFKSKPGFEKSIQTDAWHFIELPPLNQPQCLEFLQNLSAQPGALISFNSINEPLVATLYRQTQGIPGLLIAELPKLNQYQRRQYRRLGNWGGGILLIAVAAWIINNHLPDFNFLGLPDRENTQVKASTEGASVEPELIAPAAMPEQSVTSALHGDLLDASLPPVLPVQGQSPVPPVELSSFKAEKAANVPQAENNQTTEPSNSAKLTEEPTVAKKVETSSKSMTATSPAAIKVDEIKPTEKPPAPILSPETAKSNAATPEQTGIDESDWIQAQPAGNYTLQVMVLSSKSSANRFVSRYAQYKDQLRYYAIGREGQEKYVLIYGSFQTGTEALKQKAAMPGEFAQALVKSFKQIQKESRRKN